MNVQQRTTATQRALTRQQTDWDSLYLNEQVGGKGLAWCMGINDAVNHNKGIDKVKKLMEE